MNILDLINNLKIPGETFVLQHLTYDTEHPNEYDQLEEVWMDDTVLNGTIQRESWDPDSKRGFEEITDYNGYFEPNFEIEDNDIGNYRIVNELEYDDTEFTRYFKIHKINRNLTMDNQRVFYKLYLELVRVW